MAKAWHCPPIRARTLPASISPRPCRANRRAATETFPKVLAFYPHEIHVHGSDSYRRSCVRIILFHDSRTAGERAGPEFVRSGANHVGRSRGNASKPAVVHLTGAPRPE